MPIKTHKIYSKVLNSSNIICNRHSISLILLNEEYITIMMTVKVFPLHIPVNINNT